MELKPYSAETKDNFWISIGYHICKLRVDFDRIYTNIGEYNFYETGRIRQLIFYYIHPDQILSRLITHLSRVMHSLDYNNESTSHIESGDISIPIQSIFFKLAPDYTYTKLLNSTKKSKTMTNEDLTFILDEVGLGEIEISSIISSSILVTQPQLVEYTLFGSKTGPVQFQVIPEARLL